MTTLHSRLLRHVRHGFGDRRHPVPAELATEWECVKPIWKQVHGDRICQVSLAGQTLGDCDGVWTRAPGQGVAVVTADCVPILFARRDGRAVGAVHAGWRGTLAKIALRQVEAIVSSGDDPRDWVAAIGPAIGPCCYQVSSDLIERFCTEFCASPLPLMARQQIEPRPRMLNLWEVNRAQLQAAGISEIDVLARCTSCEQIEGGFRFESYRREPGTRRQFSLVFCNS